MRAINGIGVGVRFTLLLRRGLGDRQQRANVLDVAGSHGAGEQAKMPDAVKAARQHVHEKPADELGGVERHGLEPVTSLKPIVFPFEGDACVVEGDKS